VDGKWHYTDGQPGAHVLDKFKKRSDNQIASLEILAAEVGLSSFAEELRERRVILFTDNKGAEVSDC